MADSSDLSVILPRGIHPFPSRTRKLSPAGPMVLHAPSVWERRSLPALIKASLRDQIGLFLLVTSGQKWPVVQSFLCRASLENPSSRASQCSFSQSWLLLVLILNSFVPYGWTFTSVSIA